MRMELKIEALHYRLQFRHAFRIAHGQRTHTDTVYVKASADGKTGFGEAALPPYLGYNHEEIIKEINSFSTGYSGIADALKALHLKNLSRPAKATIDLALHDLWLKLSGRNSIDLNQIPAKSSSTCFFTLGISSEEELEKKLEESFGTKVYKIKLGGEHDMDFIRAFRKRSDLPFCADANQAWKNCEEAIHQIQLLKDQGCIFIEQPLPVDHSDQQKLYTKTSLPIYLDESIQSKDDITRLANSCHGINIKLVKSGGLAPALEWIRTAQENKLDILIGCMSESTCGAAAALQLGAVAEYVDLDGPLLISNDPFTGLHYNSGEVELQISGLQTELFRF